jgi:uncharacterized membrane protein YagU involved in acid resistance
MDSRQHPLTPLAAVAGGILAGAVGTAAMDAVLYARYRRSGGKDAPLSWEFPPTESWQQASDPGQVVKRVIEGFTQRPIPDRWARTATIAAHWAFGSASGAAYGVLAGSRRQPKPAYGLPFGAAVWALGYIVLPQAGLYEQIWKYDVETLAKDLTAHLTYGAVTGAAFWLLASAL